MFIIIKKKAAFAAIAGLVAAAVILAIVWPQERASTTSAEGSWGLSFQEAGHVPIANTTAEELAEYNAYYVEETDEKVLYLTFDAGFENGYMEAILDVLKKHQVPAAFFVVGNYIESEPELIKRMVKEGHIVGNHTFSHPDMTLLSEEEFRNQLTDMEALYKEVTGREMKKFYRPPQGSYTFDNLKLASEMGYTTVFWSLAYVDWYQDRQPSEEEAYKKMVPRIHPGAIVLLHSTSETNAKVLDQLISKWKQLGYSFKSLDQLGQN